jgi:hypothetical protein
MKFDARHALSSEEKDAFAAGPADETASTFKILTA